MKKIGIIAGIFLVAIVTGILVIRVHEVDTDVTKNETKVGVILNGSKEDRSWGQSHYEALEATAEKLNLDITYMENVPETAECAEVFEQLAGAGCRIIIANSYGFGEWELEAAKKHPEIYYYHATGTQTAENLATYFGRIYQIRYLCGVVAGLQTVTDEIGYVAAFPIPEVNRGINAFTLGVRSVNPDAKVYVQWSGSWTEDEPTEEAARALLASHNIDVFAMHTDSLKVLEVAEEKGIWSIGYNMDNSDLFPNTWLTAAVWNWQDFYEPRILECLQGKFQGKDYWEGVDSGMVALAPLSSKVNPEAKQAVEREKERFEKGTFDVFYGPIKDAEGNLRIGEGESMTDEKMLNEFDWYVEGVIINE
ncbi:MAG: BMP family ABC transporter substrate-binding protein [Acetatifactor sp.]